MSKRLSIFFVSLLVVGITSRMNTTRYYSIFFKSCYEKRETDKLPRKNRDLEWTGVLSANLCSPAWKGSRASLGHQASCFEKGLFSSPCSLRHSPRSTQSYYSPLTSCSSAGSSPSSKRHSRKRTMSASMRLFGVVCGLRDNPRTTLAAVLESDRVAEEGPAACFVTRL